MINNSNLRLLRINGYFDDTPCSCDYCKARTDRKGLLRGIKYATIIMGALFALLFVKCAHAENIDGYDIEKWASAIRHAEGNPNYGILSHYKHTSYKQACINTIRHKYKLWLKTNKKEKFIYYLASKYAPINCNTDNGTNKYWKNNVEYWLKRS